MKFAKIVPGIHDSSLARNWKTRAVFTDFLILCDDDGVVDMTIDAISRRTNVPLEIVSEAIKELEAPDPESRTPDNEGRRIVRLDPHRNWGWRIVNYRRYRESFSKAMLRMSEAERKREYRAKKHRSPSPTPPTSEKKDKEGENKNSPGFVSDTSGTVRDKPPLNGISPAERITREKELKDVRASIDAIRAKYANGEKRSDADRKKLTGLKDRWGELLEILGMTSLLKE